MRTQKHGLTGLAYGATDVTSSKAIVSLDFNDLIAAIGYDVS